MSPSSDNIQIFNLETMSGVFPGTRTKIYQRLRLQNLHTQNDYLQVAAQFSDDTVLSNDDVLWAQLLWYNDPSACVLFTHDTESRTMASLLRIENPQKETILVNLEDALAPTGRQPFCCGACRFLASALSQTQDGFPSGRCEWQPADSANIVAAPSQMDSHFVAHQSILALGCNQWQPRVNPLAVASETDATPQLLPAMPKAAEFSAVALKASASTPWKRLQTFAKGLLQPRRGAASDARPSPAHSNLVERSGVGAGTEPCFVCQGRLANLSALVVETTEGDKQTYSLWRCRNCFSYFLSNWIDRWERLDNLETEETHYRLPPAEALLVLKQSTQTQGSDHPAGRQQRIAQRTWFEQFLQGREPLSHQIKLGR